MTPIRTSAITTRSAQLAAGDSKDLVQIMSCTYITLTVA